MPSHFSSIGMPVDTDKDMVNLLKKASKYADKIFCKYGYYLNWKSKTGAELWIHIDINGKCIGVNPFYNGESIFSAGVIKKIEREGDNDFEGAFYGWADPQDNNPENGLYPFNFDCVNLAVNEGLFLPCILNIKLSAFAHEIDVFLNEGDHRSSQKEEPHFASKSFIPSGVFPPGTNTEAIFTGTILNHRLFRNELTGKKYYWIKTETLGGIIDVVADPELIKKKLQINGIITGSFYLSGKIMKD